MFENYFSIEDDEDERNAKVLDHTSDIIELLDKEEMFDFIEALVRWYDNHVA